MKIRHTTRILRQLNPARLRWLPMSSIILGLFVIAAVSGSSDSILAASDDPLIQQSPGVVHRDETLGLSFSYPDNWQLQENGWPNLENGSETFLTADAFGIISLISEPSLLTPEQWFTNNRYQFHAQHVGEAGMFLVGGEPALILYQPNTCETAAMLYAIFEHENRLFRLMYLATGSQVSVTAFEAILQSLTFHSAPRASAALPDISTLDFNAMQLESTACNDERAQEWAEEATSARKCSDASMYIPTEGTLIAPWGCWDNPVCPMYNPNAPDPYFRNPHRGLDIAGGQGPGVTPVYATFDGVVNLYGESSIRHFFDAPFAGIAGYYAHMAAQNPYQDYRVVVNGQRVQAGITLLGTQGFYGLGSPSNTHLHISYHNSNTGETPWPTYDPTQFLKAEHLAYFTGWQVEGPIQCSSGEGCCACGSLVNSENGLTTNPFFNAYGPPAPERPLDFGPIIPEEVVAPTWPRLEGSVTSGTFSSEDNKSEAQVEIGGYDLMGIAGNESTPAIAKAQVEIDAGLPASSNYRLSRSVMGMGGGIKSSSSYVLLGTSGQPFATGLRTSSNYRLNSGYWGAPITTPTPTATSTPTATPPTMATSTPTVTPTLMPTLPPEFDYHLGLPVIITDEG